MLQVTKTHCCLEHDMGFLVMKACVMAYGMIRLYAMLLRVSHIYAIN